MRPVPAGGTDAKADARSSAPRTERAIRIAQGLAVALIVMFHANALLAREGLSFPGNRTALMLLSPALLALFFFCAGRSFGQRHRSSLRKHVVNRVDGYLWILLVWNAVYIPVYQVYRYLHRPPAHPSADGLGDIILMPNLRDVLKFFILPSNLTWFVYCIFIYIIVTYFAVIRDKVAALFCAVVCLDIAVWSLGKFEPTVTLQYFEIFLLGHIFGASITRALERSGRVARLCLVITYLAACSAAQSWLPLDTPVVATIVRLTGLLSLIGIALSLPSWLRADRLAGIAAFMLPIYLMHELLLVGLVSVLHGGHVETESSLVRALSTPVVGIACLLICIAVFRSTRFAHVLIFRPRGFRPVAALTAPAAPDPRGPAIG